MLRDFFLGFVKIHILRHAEEEPVYGPVPAGGAIGLAILYLG